MGHTSWTLCIDQHGGSSERARKHSKRDVGVQTEKELTVAAMNGSMLLTLKSEQEVFF